MLRARYEDAKERCLVVHKEEKRLVKRCIYQNQGGGPRTLGRKMNQDVNGNRKFFWKEVSKAKGEKVENSNRIKDGNGGLAMEEVEL